MTTWTLHTGDSLAVLNTLTEPVDAVICDPPYNSGGRTNAARRAETARGKYVRGDAQHTLPDFDGDNRDQRGYTYWLSLVLADTYRLGRPAGGWRDLARQHPLAQADQQTREERLPRECEYVLWGSRGDP
ncbi:hypothetical protein [Streptomyces sp. NPDC001642]|uniref:hypothetical protein n=1 Tax=Streptomyces sp. NPDC001642 TaxID=3154392 RepID=UPI0033192DB9